MILILCILSYLIGSIPTAYIIGKLNNIDIRNYGSKNIGATNVYRILGKKWGSVTFIIDFLKGFIPTYLVMKYYSNPYITISIGGLTIIGHIFTLFLNFKGGKGVATSTGVFMVISPKTIMIALIVFTIVVLIFRYVSLATLIATAVFLFTSIISNIEVEFKYMIGVVSAIIYITHISNIKRLMKGEELKV
jgi:glycerol-3-phosphate acyltransferase PlsY